MNTKTSFPKCGDGSPNTSPTTTPRNSNMSSSSPDQAKKSSETTVQPQDTTFLTSVGESIFNPFIASNQEEEEEDLKPSSRKRKVQSTMDVYLHANGCIEVIKKKPKIEEGTKEEDADETPPANKDRMDCDESSSDVESLPELDASMEEKMPCTGPRRPLNLQHDQQDQQGSGWVLMPPHELQASQQYMSVVEDEKDGTDDCNVRVVSPQGLSPDGNNEAAHAFDGMAYKTPK